MSFQSEVEMRIARERRRIAELRNEIMRRESFVAGLEAALKIIPSEEGPQSSSVEPLRTGSDVKKAQQLLMTVKGALHISDILKGIGKEDTKQNRASLASSLARYARRGEIFQREGPNEFALISPNSPSVNTEDDTPEFPSLFGAGG